MLVQIPCIVPSKSAKETSIYEGLQVQPKFTVFFLGNQRMLLEPCISAFVGSPTEAVKTRHETKKLCHVM